MSCRLLRALAVATSLAPAAIATAVADAPTEWKRQYQRGALVTPYKHYSVIADGVAGQRTEEFGARPGPAFLGMKVWASSTAEAAHMARLFANRSGFALQGKIEVYVTEPTEPPREKPHADGVKFTPYDPARK